MKKNYVAWLLIVLTAALFISCQAHHERVVQSQFQPIDLNAELKSGNYQPKAENFVVILDASPSTRDTQSGMTVFESEKAFLFRMNRSIPQIELNSSLRSFGHWQHGGETILHYGPTRWDRDSFQSALDGVPQGGGKSPVDQGFDLSSNDMSSLTGRTAVILVGDGQYQGVDAVSAAKRLKARYGGNACIYTVLAGSAEPESVATMEEIAAAGGCGFYQNAGDLESPQAMASWIEAVFLNKIAPRHRSLRHRPFRHHWTATVTAFTIKPTSAPTRPKELPWIIADAGYLRALILTRPNGTFNPDTIPSLMV
jgi:OOP family OmpA-OmpF porin